MHVVGLDIGGANLKAADVDGRTQSVPFEIWKRPGDLPNELAKLLAQFAHPDAVAVTMTAELADCFTTKAEGVDFILRSVARAAGDVPVSVWQTGAELVPPEVARDIPLLVAAANWHALATWLGRLAPEGSALLFDVGSTTTDIIPLLDGVPVPSGLTDCERLQAGELVYTGIRRTPLYAVAHSVPFRGGYCPLAAELFATTLDVHLILGHLPENGDDCHTANGKPATRTAARDRLARMLCCDASEFSWDDAEATAHFLAGVQRQRITAALDRVLANLDNVVGSLREPRMHSRSECTTLVNPVIECEAVLVSGSGSFLADEIVEPHRRLKEARVVHLSEMFDPSLSEAACAFAVARLAAERLVR